jgi:hypothetical protein
VAVRSRCQASYCIIVSITSSQHQTLCEHTRTPAVQVALHSGSQHVGSTHAL